MSVAYREHAPSPLLAPYVECFWSIEAGAVIVEYPVLPDGCADIVFARGTAPGLRLVGTMTEARRFTLAAGDFQMGVRFRPGMAASFIKLPGSESTDRMIPLSDVWGAAAKQLENQIVEAASAERAIAVLEAQLVDPAEPGTVQQIAAYVVETNGQVRVDDLAFSAGMSARQLRRLFVEQIGLSPKHFCRVIRFRNSVAQLSDKGRGDWTQVALDCGYYDQAHFINEFRELSGYTPSEFASRPR